MRPKCFDDYEEERRRQTPEQIDLILHEARRWDLAPVLQGGGVIVFAHTFLSACASGIAAAVHAALDSGSDRVLALGVMHATNQKRLEARIVEQQSIKGSHLDLRGVYGPDLPGAEELFHEYSLLSFLFLWHEEIKRRGCKPPKLYCRYPFLVNRSPETLLGMKELEEIANDAVIVATSDFCHHGAAYGAPPDACLEIGSDALSFAKSCVSRHLHLLETASYDDFYAHCLEIKSDSFDVSTVVKYLRAPFQTELLDISLVDTSSLYDTRPVPSWVAASLVVFNSK